MRVEIKRENLLKPLQNVVGVVERRQTLPILSNVLTIADDQGLKLTATDLEVELSARTDLPIDAPGEVTLPARKLWDIIRALPEGADVSLAVQDEGKALVRCGRSRFSLATLPAADFQTLEELPFEGDVRLPQRDLKKLIERSHFAMAQQDVRYYLNGLLLEIGGNRLRAVATDGHRLALCDVKGAVEPEDFERQVILPRKGIQELSRLLADSEDEALLKIGPNHVQVLLGHIRFTSKLIDGKFPDYHRVIPRESDQPILADRLLLRGALARTAILSNDQYRGVRLQLQPWKLHLQAHNPEQEEAEEDLEVNYNGGEMEIGFNVTYLLDALAALDGELVKLSITDSNSSCLLQEAEETACKYVIMPMRL
jgi:DNA polymerase-3 subunit beta